MKQDVCLFVQQRLTCQQQKYETLSLAGLVQPLPIPTHVWEEILIDFIVYLPISNRFHTILVLVDQLSKYTHFLGLSHTHTQFWLIGLLYRDCSSSWFSPFDYF